MEDAVLLAAGLFVPPVVSWLKRQSWPSNVKFLFSVAVAFVAASVVMVAQGDVGSWAEYLGKVSIVWTEAQLIYNLYFGGTQLNDTLEKINIFTGKGKKDLH